MIERVVASPKALISFLSIPNLNSFLEKSVLCEIMASALDRDKFNLKPRHRPKGASFSFKRCLVDSNTLPVI